MATARVVITVRELGVAAIAGRRGCRRPTAHPCRRRYALHGESRPYRDPSRLGCPEGLVLVYGTQRERVYGWPRAPLCVRRAIVLVRRFSPTLSGVRSLRERRDAGEELRRLSPEQAHGGQELRRAQGRALGVAGTDDRAARELPIEELRRLGHDPVGLEQRPTRLQVRERESGGGVGQRRSVAGLVLPRLEMHRLRGADADQDAQHLGARRSLCEGGVETRAALLDRAEVEAGRVRDRLQ